MVMAIDYIYLIKIYIYIFEFLPKNSATMSAEPHNVIFFLEDIFLKFTYLFIYLF